MRRRPDNRYEPAIIQVLRKMAAVSGLQMDPMFLAMSFFRRRKFEECAEVCTQLLKKNPYDQVDFIFVVISYTSVFDEEMERVCFGWTACNIRYIFPCLQSAWCLKTRALTEQVYVDEVDVDEEGIAEMLMDDNAVAQLPRQLKSIFLSFIHFLPCSFI